MVQPLTYSYNSVAQEVLCAPDAINSLPGVLDRAGATRAMVVCGPSILEKSNVVQRVQTALGDRCVGLFSGVAPHSPVHTLDEAMRLAGNLKPDVLVSVGGGSTHDTSKGISTLLGEGEPSMTIRCTLSRRIRSSSLSSLPTGCPSSQCPPPWVVPN